MTFYCYKIKTDIDVCQCLNTKNCICGAGRGYAEKEEPHYNAQTEETSHWFQRQGSPKLKNCQVCGEPIN